MLYTRRDARFCVSTASIVYLIAVVGLNRLGWERMNFCDVFPFPSLPIPTKVPYVTTSIIIAPVKYVVGDCSGNFIVILSLSV